LVLELAEGDLNDFVVQRGGSLTTDEVKRVALEVLEGLAELHDIHVVHRDLKPSNVLFSQERFLLTDFGISKDRDRPVTQNTFRRAGTGGYAAPEQLLTGREAKPSADVYSFGKLLVFLLTGSTDIDHLSFRQWRSLIRDCTAEDERDRPSIKILRQQLLSIDE